MNRPSIRTWFSTTRGRNVTFIGVSVAACGIPAAYYTAHTFLLHKYKEVVQMYGLGIGIPVSEKVMKRFETVMDDKKLSETVKKYIKPFTVFGFDMFHAGCTHTRTGAIVGIPSNFNYETTADVDSNILVNLDLVAWNSDAGKSLQEAMVLSEDAQKFAIGREITSVQTFYIHLQSIVPAIIIILLYGFTSSCNEKLGLFYRSMSIRLVLYILVGLFGMGTWTFLQDFLTVYYETYTDREMCKLGEKYIKGGIEFYSKLLQRNIALRSLMGNKGPELYTVTGNNEYMLRQKHVPLTTRKEYMEQQLKELKNNEVESIDTE